MIDWYSSFHLQNLKAEKARLQGDLDATCKVKDDNAQQLQVGYAFHYSRSTSTVLEELCFLFSRYEPKRKLCAKKSRRSNQLTMTSHANCSRPTSSEFWLSVPSDVYVMTSHGYGSHPFFKVAAEVESCERLGVATTEADVRTYCGQGRIGSSAEEERGKCTCTFREFHSVVWLCQTCASCKLVVVFTSLLKRTMLTN